MNTNGLMTLTLSTGSELTHTLAKEFADDAEIAKALAGQIVVSDAQRSVLLKLMRKAQRELEDKAETANASVGRMAKELEARRAERDEIEQTQKQVNEAISLLHRREVA